MSAGAYSETKQVRYLLGLSSPAEREHIQSEFFHSEDAFQQMIAAEDDLYDAYARGELTGEERRRFETHFLKTIRGRDRVQFARALADVACDAPLIETTPHAGLLDAFHGWRGALRLAMIATVLVLAATVSWLAFDRRRISNELRDLRAKSVERDKQIQTPPQISSADNLKHPQVTATSTRRASKKNSREKSEVRFPVKPESVMNTQDTSLGNNFLSKRITELPLNARNLPNLLSLQPAVTSDGYVAGARRDQAGVTLDGVDAKAVTVTSSLPWIRFLIRLEMPAQHTDYRLTIKKGSVQVVEVDWIEPITPDQTSIDTPTIPTVDLPSGDYVLLLMAKEPDGSYVKLAEYSFMVNKY